ncbi:MAG: helix-turn-helix transcriptional regulator, partial [Treponema sp.]|nr:helix-turn-helix transcriptional regulator [Treponema sp.]
EEEKKETWNKTAMWCEANNQKTDAINYYKKAENYERLILVMFMLPFAMANRTARMLLEILRPEICTIVPSAYIIRAKLYIILGMPEQADKELVTTIEALKAQPPSPEINRVLSGCYNFRGFAGIQTSTYTRDYNYLHYFKNARQYYDKSPFETKPPMSVGFLSTYVCRVNSEEKGEMERYIDAITAMVPHTSYTLGGFGSGMENLTRAELAFFKGDLSVAEQAAYTALNKARQADQYEIENRALFYLLRINLARGNWEAVQGVFKQMEAQLDQPYYLNRFIFHDIVAGWYYAHIGQTEKPVLWLKNDFEESDFGSTTFDLEILVKAKYHFSEKRYPAALAVLKSRELKDGHRDYVLGKIEKKALEAVCRHRSRDRSGAFASLETAYRLAAPNGLDMPFIELGKDMRSLANAALKDGSNIPCEWLEKIRLGASAYAKNLFTVISRLFDLSTRPDSRDKFSRRNAVRIAAKMNLG